MIYDRKASSRSQCKQARTHTLTGTGHGGGVSLSAEVVFLTATVQRPFMMREAMRRTLCTLRVPQCRFVEARPAHWKQKNRHREMHEHHAEAAHHRLPGAPAASKYGK